VRVPAAFRTHASEVRKITATAQFKGGGMKSADPEMVCVALLASQFVPWISGLKPLMVIDCTGHGGDC